MMEKGLLAPSRPGLSGISTALRRGLRRRCPRCGEGALFRRLIDLHQRCSSCNLRYQRDYGDMWLYIIILDRIPVGLGLILVYFGFQSSNWLSGLAFLLGVAGPLILTLPHRHGLALALDYLSRIYLPDPADEIHCGPAYVVTAEPGPEAYRERGQPGRWTAGSLPADF